MGIFLRQRQRHRRWLSGLVAGWFGGWVVWWLGGLVVLKGFLESFYVLFRIFFDGELKKGDEFLGDSKL